ncbi:hypothetical protein D1872_297370 [compost metagenome]
MVKDERHRPQKDTHNKDGGSNFEHIAQNLLGSFEPFYGDGQELALGSHMEGVEGTRDQVGNNRSGRNADHAPVEHEDDERIQNNINEDTEHHTDHRRDGRTFRAHDIFQREK